MVCWLLNNGISILGILVGGFIAYHVYFLSRRINLKDKLSHRDEIRKKVEPILNNIRNGISSKVEIVNVKKYSKHYPLNNELNKDGYTYLGAELKTLRFDGVEFFCGVRELYKKEDGKFTLKAENNAVRQNKNVFEVGLILYEWIDYVDGGGDEFSYRPQFFVKFKGLKKSPYKYFSYYIESDTYQERNDPVDFKWRSIEIK